MKRKFRICLLILIPVISGVVCIYITGCRKACCTIGFVLSTDSVSAITPATAQSGGTISSDDEDTVLVRGVCWNTRQTPTIENDTTSDGHGTGKFKSLITRLAPNTFYFVRAYLINRKGTAYGDERTFKTASGPIFTIGATYGGGIIFYIDKTGVHGLIAATADLMKKAEWGCSGLLIPGANGTAVGTGVKNTDTITYGCNEPAIAARICLQFGSGNYSDWSLPSKDELDTLYMQKAVVGGFSNGVYWSSSQVNKDSAWAQNFNNGAQMHRNKLDSAIVRPVRAF